MKNFMLNCGLILLMLTIGNINTANAQARHDDTKACGQSGTYHKILESPLCYPRSDYPTIHKAREQFHKDLTAQLTCTNNCLDKDLYDCKPVDVSGVDEGDLARDGDSYCSGLTIKFEWSCTKCTRKPIVVDDKPVPVGDHGGEATGDDPKNREGFQDFLADHDHGSLENRTAQIGNIYPNPSTGIFRLNVDVPQDNSLVNLTVTNISGSVVVNKDYAESPRSHFQAQADLSNQPEGVYMVAVSVNGELIRTSKLMLQK